MRGIHYQVIFHSSSRPYINNVQVHNRQFSRNGKIQLDAYTWTPGNPTASLSESI